MLIGIVLLAIVIFGTYLFVKKNPNNSISKEAEELVEKAEADGYKFVAYSEEELAKIEAGVVTKIKTVI